MLVFQPVRGGHIPQRYQRSIRKDTALYNQILPIWGRFAKMWGANAKGAVKSQRWGRIAKTLPPKRKGFLNSGVKTQKTVVIDRLFFVFVNIFFVIAGLFFDTQRPNFACLLIPYA